MGILIGLWALGLAPAFVGLGLFFESVRDFGFAVVTSLNGLAHAFLSVGLIALGAMMALGMIYATKWFALITAKYVRLNFDIITK